MGYRSLKRRAITIANHSSQEIVLRVYQHLINKHQEFCTCDYCNILKEYVHRKKRLTRYHRLYEDIGDDDTYNTYLREKAIIRSLKLQKDELKKLKL